jgi:hypothetical protein
MRIQWLNARLSAEQQLLCCLLVQVLEHPIPNVSALPLDDDLFTWHGNGM